MTVGQLFCILLALRSQGEIQRGLKVVSVVRVPVLKISVTILSSDLNSKERGLPTSRESFNISNSSWDFLKNKADKINMV